MENAFVIPFDIYSGHMLSAKDLIALSNNMTDQQQIQKISVQIQQLIDKIDINKDSINEIINILSKWKNDSISYC